MSSHFRLSYDAIGTAATPATLTPAFSGNLKVLLVDRLPNFHFEVKYTPSALGVAASYAMILLETSNDGGTTYFPLSTVTPSTQEQDVWTDGGTGMSAASGIPFIVPGDKTVTPGTPVYASYDLTVACQYLRISARENVGSNFGTVYIRATFQD